MASSIDRHVTFDLQLIKEEEKWQCFESPLKKYVHPKFHLNLIDPRCPQKWVFLWLSARYIIYYVSYIFINFLC